jgi:hypothetical protein
MAGGFASLCVPVNARQVVTTVPFVAFGGKIYVNASVNGRIPTYFLVDTGATGAVLTQSVADRSAASIVDGRGTLASLTVGGLTVERVAFAARSRSLKLAPALGGEAWSPLAAGLSLQIDYAARRLTIGADMPDEPFGVDIPLELRRVPTVQVVVAGIPRRFVVDTASPVTTIRPGITPTLPPDTRIRLAPVRLYDTWGRLDARAAVALPGPALAVGEIRFDRYPLILHDTPDATRELGFTIDGLLGADFLARYRVTFDLRRALLRLYQVR